MIASGNPRNAARIRAAHRVAWLVLVSISISVVIYTVVGLLVVSARAMPQEQPQLRIPFSVAALFLVLAPFSFRRTQLRWIRLQAAAAIPRRDGLAKHPVYV